MEYNQKTKNDRMKYIYKSAKIFLLDISSNELEEKEINRYFNIVKSFKSKNDILYRLLLSLQNRQMSKNVIGLEKEERKKSFQKILFDYDSIKILNAYDENSLLKEFSNYFKIKNIDSNNNLWRLYSKSVISASKFIIKFKDIKDFDNFVNVFKYNEMSSAALPMLLEKEIIGLGFPLACDFLKELGYCEYPKPDVHIKDIFVAFGLCDNNDYSAYKAVIEMAKVVNDSPYNVDKLFWLIGSGNFYLHNINIGRNKEKFINLINENIKINI